LLIPITAALVHEKDTPDVPLVGLYAKVVALHNAGGVKLLVSFGIGYTVTTTM
jgi:hypothetical protein